MLKHTKWQRYCLLLACAFALPMTWASPEYAGATNLAAAFHAAWQNAPQARTLEARRAEISAANDAARAWTAGPPSIGLAQRNENSQARNGSRETEVSLAAPLWLPGQQSARLRLALASAEDWEAQLAKEKWQVAGEVREQLWAVAATREIFAEAQDHLDHLTALANEVMRRVKLGDVARSDGMLAQQEVLAARAHLGVLRLRMQEAISQYQTLTGQLEAPPAIEEPIGKLALDEHPRLRAARAALQYAQTEQSLLQASRSDAPTLAIAMRREQEAGGAGSNRSIGLSLHIPLGSSARNRPLETAALTKIESAQAQMQQTERQLVAAIALAQQQLTSAREVWEIYAARRAMTQEHAKLIEKAFHLGERGLAEVLRAQTLVHEADAAARQQRVALGLAHARLNQALGILP